MNIMVRSTAVVLLMLILASCTNEDSDYSGESFKFLFKRSQELFKERKYTDALRVCEMAIQNNKNHQ